MIKRLYTKQLFRRAQIKLNRVLPLVSQNERLLDIGSGNGSVCLYLKNAGYDVTPLDVKDRNYFEETSPRLYDGLNIPFESQSFDVALLLTMLHHTPNPELIIKEAMRIAPKIVIMEDIYSNQLQQQLTYFTDSLVNQEFRGHPHTNKTHEGWLEVFQKLNLNVIKVIHHDRFLLFFKQVTYVLNVNS